MKISIIEFFVFSFRNIILEFIFIIFSGFISIKILKRQKKLTYWVVYLYMFNVITFTYGAQLLQLQVHVYIHLSNNHIMISYHKSYYMDIFTIKF